MRIIFLIIAYSFWNESIAQKRQPTNIIFILADDLGYGDLGVYGQNWIETPNINSLAKEGMRFNQFYSGAPVCAPARYTLLTGKHTGHSFIRGNDEWGTRGNVWSFASMLENPKLEGQYPIPDSTYTLAEMLKEKGYTTAAIGKWGLGAPETEGLPTRQGFDFFYGYNCQRWAHTYYPPFLWKNEKRVPLENALMLAAQKWNPGIDSSKEENYAPYIGREYAPESMLKEAVHFIKTNKNNPFFLYFASPIPHAGLQAPSRWIDYYKNKIGAEKPYLGEKGYVPSFAPKATYAAMVSYLDEQVGTLISTLKTEGLFESTLIIFTSDNGPTYAGGVDATFFNSAGPFPENADRIKGSVFEGGIRVPFIAHWPNKIKAGTISEHIGYFPDIFPTLCDLVGSKIPDNIDGISILPTLENKRKQKVHPWLYWEFPEYGGQQAIRQGHWKLVRLQLHKGKENPALYNLSNDPLEQFDVSQQFPEKVAELSKILVSQHVEPENRKFRIGLLGDQINP
jgi:arylsulfatase